MIDIAITAGLLLALYRWTSKPRGRRQSKGDEGERCVASELRAVLDWLCPGNYKLFNGLIVEHAPHTAFPTAEIDHLAITPFGIFVVETKNWSGSIRVSEIDGQVTRIAPDGKASERRCPLAQSQAKVRFVQSLVTPIWSVRSVGVFADTELALDSELPINVVRRDDLRSYLRTLRHEHVVSRSPSVIIDLAAEAIAHVAVSDPHAKEAHVSRIKLSHNCHNCK